jgi:RHH-type proline utilization regulon transcriptional repressor/proline dehydrogenase/delta 1-pyrroline-5-carboxylate dehydrogenase
MHNSTRRRADARSATIPFAALQGEVLHRPSPLRAAVTAAYRRDEQEMVQWLQSQVRLTPASRIATQMLARTLVECRYAGNAPVRPGSMR